MVSVLKSEILDCSRSYTTPNIRLFLFYKKIHYLAFDLDHMNSLHHVPYAPAKFEYSEYDQEIPQSQTADNPMAP